MLHTVVFLARLTAVITAASNPSVPTNTATTPRFFSSLLHSHSWTFAFIGAIVSFLWLALHISPQHLIHVCYYFHENKFLKGTGPNACIPVNLPKPAFWECLPTIYYNNCFLKKECQSELLKLPPTKNSLTLTLHRNNCVYVSYLLTTSYWHKHYQHSRLIVFSSCVKNFIERYKWI